ncbi:acyl-CoA thioesterase [Marinobacterium sediminicola]|uniref:Acyl-CoA thioester hydrolase n=1 Tax=Marinobacterium sediminicola TaxID=518898 RepID=A0ABY1S0I2_9GAMM|nr:thioesterase family protein [Marinobacterium sediminicola]ULG68408.1 acyl-CoA thioesterase [Marinobacterium sediminicola]SMR74712.1 acyl-CoA thioester hydrolase [Marinobacterium sediminicola]
MFSTMISPAFYDTDGLGHINNTRVPQWFEAARNELFRIFTPDLDMKKWQLIMARIEVDYLAELFYGRNVEVRTFVCKIGNSSFTVLQEAWQGDKLAARGKAFMVRYDFANGRAMSLTDEQKASLEVHFKADT